jgi:hypothetical protein
VRERERERLILNCIIEKLIVKMGIVPWISVTEFTLLAKLMSESIDFNMRNEFHAFLNSEKHFEFCFSVLY